MRDHDTNIVCVSEASRKLPGVNLPRCTSQPLLWWLTFSTVQIRLRESLGFKKNTLLVNITHWWKKTIYEADLEFNTTGILIAGWKHIHLGLGFIHAKCWQRNLTMSQAHITIWLVGVIILNWYLNSSCSEIILIAVIRWQLLKWEHIHSNPGNQCYSFTVNSSLNTELSFCLVLD